MLKYETADSPLIANQCYTDFNLLNSIALFFSVISPFLLHWSLFEIDLARFYQLDTKNIPDFTCLPRKAKEHNFSIVHHQEQSQFFAKYSMLTWTPSLWTTCPRCYKRGTMQTKELSSLAVEKAAMKHMCLFLTTASSSMQATVGVVYVWQGPCSSLLRHSVGLLHNYCSPFCKWQKKFFNLWAAQASRYICAVFFCLFLAAHIQLYMLTLWILI